MNEHSGAAIAVLLSPPGRAALVAGRIGEVVRLARRAHGWKQDDLAQCAGYSQATVSRLEREEGRAARDTAVLTDIAGALGIPSSALGVVDNATRTPTLEDMERRNFLGGSVALAVTAMLPQGVASAGTISSGDTQQCWVALRRIFELDDHHGASTIYRMSEEMAKRLRTALQRGTVAPSAKQELQRVTAATMDQAGWLAYDTGQPDAARRWWLETYHLASMTGDDEAHVSALARMMKQANDAERGGEAVELVHAARAAVGRATPTVLSVLAAREAVGHAHAGDGAAAVSAINESRRHLDHGRSADDPPWVGFWGPADLAAHETDVALAARNGRLAERSARLALDSNNAERFPRNHTSYTERLGSVLTRLGQFDEAIHLTGDALQRANTITGSQRINTRLRQTVALLGQQKYAPAREFAKAARPLLPT
ncbi:MAG: helix-turn-helix domain-containing protein [Sciscionella sp.]